MVPLVLVNTSQRHLAHLRQIKPNLNTYKQITRIHKTKASLWLWSWTEASNTVTGIEGERGQTYLYGKKNKITIHWSIFFFHIHLPLHSRVCFGGKKKQYKKNITVWIRFWMRWKRGNIFIFFFSFYYHALENIYWPVYLSVDPFSCLLAGEENMHGLTRVLRGLKWKGEKINVKTWK